MQKPKLMIPLLVVPPMPGASNRPQIAGSVLSWSGPQGGGASNGSYVKQTRTLASSGAIKTSAPGQIIEGLDIQGRGGLTNGVVTINHSNVTLRQCRVLETTAAQPDKYTVFIAKGVTGTIIEDCLIDGHAQNGGGGTSCVSGDVGLGGPGVNGIIMRRNTCIRSEQAIRYILNNVQFLENWCHSIGGQDADWVEIYPYGTSCNNILVQYNTFDGTDNKAGGADSAVNMTTASGLPVGNIGPEILIDHNWMVHWSEVHFLVASNDGGGKLAFGITNNGFLKGFLDNNSPVDGTCAPNSGNYVMATPSSLTGPLYHGTGML
jgi:hypothetical protein